MLLGSTFAAEDGCCDGVDETAWLEVVDDLEMMATELDDAALLPIASVLDVCFVFSLLRCLLEIEEEVALSFESDRLSDRALKIREMTTIAPANIEMIFFICDTSSVIVTLIRANYIIFYKAVIIPQKLMSECSDYEILKKMKKHMGERKCSMKKISGF